MNSPMSVKVAFVKLPKSVLWNNWELTFLMSKHPLGITTLGHEPRATHVQCLDIKNVLKGRNAQE
jgi:hypothetical protein